MVTKTCSVCPLAFPVFCRVRSFKLMHKVQFDSVHLFSVFSTLVANDLLERLVSEMMSNVSMGMLNPTQPRTE